MQKIKSKKYISFQLLIFTKKIDTWNAMKFLLKITKEYKKCSLINIFCEKINAILWLIDNIVKCICFHFPIIYSKKNLFFCKKTNFFFQNLSKKKVELINNTYFYSKRGYLSFVDLIYFFFVITIYLKKIYTKRFDILKKTFFTNFNFQKKYNKKFFFKINGESIFSFRITETFKRKFDKPKKIRVNQVYNFLNFLKIKKKDFYCKSYVFFHEIEFRFSKHSKFLNSGQKNFVFYKKIKEKTNYLTCGFFSRFSYNWSFYHEIFSNVFFINYKKYILSEQKFVFYKSRKISEKNLIYINKTPFIKLEMLGKGGSGKVYKVLRQDKKIFALKKNKIENFGVQIVHNFINEITILKFLLGKPRIIQIKDAEINFEKKIIFILLEYGEFDLEFFFKKKKKNYIKPLRIKIVWKQILEAVLEIHSERIIHGDLKPSNFLFIKNKLKLIDFGISTPIENNTTNIIRDIHVGTLNFMSPEAILEIPGILEQVPKFKISRASDIWSLGCILFQLSQGNSPFKDFSMIQKIHAIVNNALEIKYFFKSCYLLKDVIDNCLKRNPDFRPTIPELLDHPFLNYG